MADINKVMKALELCTTPVAPSDCAASCYKCPYSTGINTNKLNCITSLMKDSLEVMKEQNETTNICHKKNARIFYCEKCGYGINDIYLTNERDYPIEPVYCPNCGRRVID